MFPFVAVFCGTGISFSRETLKKLIYYFKNKKIFMKTRVSPGCEPIVLLQDALTSST